MPLPINFNTIPVHGRWLDLNGTPLAGSVTFTISQPLVDPSELLVIMPAPIKATLDAAGEITVSLPGTDDPDITPTGFTYDVSEDFGKGGKRSYSIQVPIATVGTLELATVSPVQPVTPNSTLVTRDTMFVDTTAARPSTSGPVAWIGQTDPGAKAVTGDLWFIPETI